MTASLPRVNARRHPAAHADGQPARTLESGQIAFNLANNWMLVGNGGAEILVDGAPLGTYGGTLTVLGVAGVAVPAKPAAGKGYEIFKLVGTPAGTTAIYSITDDWLRLRLARRLPIRSL